MNRADSATPSGGSSGASLTLTSGRPSTSAQVSAWSRSDTRPSRASSASRLPPVSSCRRRARPRSAPSAGPWPATRRRCGRRDRPGSVSLTTAFTPSSVAGRPWTLAAWCAPAPFRRGEGRAGTSGSPSTPGLPAASAQGEERAVSPPTPARCGTCAATASPRPTRRGAQLRFAAAQGALGMRHQDGDAAVVAGQAGDAVGRAVRIGGIARGDAAVAVDVAQRDMRRALVAARCRTAARPSPCATATGMREPAMPRKNSDGDSTTSSRPRRASNCSLRLRRKRGQCSAPGMIGLSCDSIWQPLHTPSAKLSVAREERGEGIAQRAAFEDRGRPAAAGAEHVAVAEATAGGEALEVVERRRGRRSGRSCARRRRRSRRGRTPPPSRSGR